MFCIVDPWTLYFRETVQTVFATSVTYRSQFWSPCLKKHIVKVKKLLHICADFALEKFQSQLSTLDAILQLNT